MAEHPSDRSSTRNEPSGGARSSRLWAGAGGVGAIVLLIAVKAISHGWRTYNRMEAEQAERAEQRRAVAAPAERTRSLLDLPAAAPPIDEEALAGAAPSRLVRTPELSRDWVPPRMEENQSFVKEMERRFAALDERQRAAPAEAARDAAALLEQRTSREKETRELLSRLVPSERGTAALFDLLGGKLADDGTGRVRSVDLSSTIAFDVNLRSIDAFEELRELNLAHTRITDAAVIPLRRRPSR